MVSEGEGGVGSLGNSWLSQDSKASYSQADKIDNSFHNSAVLSVEFNRFRVRARSKNRKINVVVTKSMLFQLNVAHKDATVT